MPYRFYRPRASAGLGQGLLPHGRAPEEGAPQFEAKQLTYPVLVLVLVQAGIENLGAHAFTHDPSWYAPMPFVAGVVAACCVLRVAVAAVVFVVAVVCCRHRCRCLLFLSS